MTSPKISPQANSDFWGKDGVVPFVGQVEDVNDPKQSGRVKVRCVGWHPKDKKEMSTEDLPWSHVAMPTTHAQQARIGGKHGLLNGCWVMGIFLDGQEAQKPFIMNTFNFVSNTTDDDNKIETQGEDGTDSEEDTAFRNTMVSPKTQPNSSLRVKDESSKGFGSQVDKAGNYLATDADHNCHGQKASQSQASDQRQNQKQTKETPEAQSAQSRQADGHCGDTPHATEDVQTKIEEMLPAQASRFTYGDIVWNRFTGNYTDMNGILGQMAYIICNTLKGNVNAKRAHTNEVRRELHSEVVGPAGFTMNREWAEIEARDIKQSDEDDIFNSMAQMFIDTMCELVMGMLQGINNEGTGNSPPGSPEIIGANPETDIRNQTDICIASTVVDNINTLSDQWIEYSMEAAEVAALNQEFNMSNIGMLFGLIAKAGIVFQFAMNQHYSGKRPFHNTSGTASQDVLTKSAGCRMDRIYNTGDGASLSPMGLVDAVKGALKDASITSAFPGGSNEAGKIGSSNNSQFIDRIPTLGFGGIDRGTLTRTTRTAVCEGATTPIVDDPGPEDPNVKPPYGPGRDPDPTTPGTGGETPGGGTGTGPGQPPGGGTTPPGTTPGTGVGTPGVTPPGFPSGPGDTCPPGYTSVGGVCVPGNPCGPGNTCPDGQICVDGVCVPEKPPACGGDGSCPTGYVCVDGVCIPEGGEVLDVGGKGREFWITCCGNIEEDTTFVSANGARALAGDCFVTLSKTVDDNAKLVTAGGEGGTPITINGEPLVAGGTGGAPVFAGQYRLATSYGIPVYVGAKGGVPLKCGASGVEGDMRVTLSDNITSFEVTRTRPAGTNAGIIGVPLPSNEGPCARNFVRGIPNQSVIIKPGQKYFFNNRRNGNLTFPSVYIPGYKGSPVPVVDRGTGEMVALLTNCRSWSANNPNPAITVIPDSNNIGIVTDDENYDITLGGFYIGNTGFDYRCPKITITDKDTGQQNSEVELITQDGRIVDYNIINSGTGFLRIPSVRIDEGCPNEDGTVSGGYGARLYPIMNVVNKSDPGQPSKPDLPPVQFIYCPSKGQRNLY